MIDTDQSLQALDDALENIFNKNLRSISKENTDRQLENLDSQIRFLIQQLEQTSARLKNSLLEDIISYLSDDIEIEDYLEKITDIKKDLFALKQTVSDGNNEFISTVNNLSANILSQSLENYNKLLEAILELKQNLKVDSEKLTELNKVSETNIISILTHQVKQLSTLVENREDRLIKAFESRHNQLLEQADLNQQELISQYAQSTTSIAKSNETNALTTNKLLNEKFDTLTIKTDNNLKAIKLLCSSNVVLTIITLVLCYIVVTH